MAVVSKKLLYAAIAGFVIFVFGLIMAFVGFPLIVDDQIYKQVRLLNGTDAFERFRELPVALDFNVYMFTVKNWKEITFEGATPEVEEMGPYVYRQYRRKTNIEYDDAEDSLTYTQYTHFEFDAEASGEYTEDDEVVVLNAGLNAIFQIMYRFVPEPLMKALIDEHWPKMFPDMLDDTIFFKTRVGDVLFDGYSFCHPKDWYFTTGVLCMVAALLDIPFLELQDDYSMKFSFFTFKQDKHDGIYSVHAGIQDVTKLGQIIQWNGLAYNTLYNDRMSHCNKIRGSDGTIHPPNLNKNEDVFIYSTEICRTARAVYVKDEMKTGVNTQKRVFTKATLGDPEEFPDNECYCGKHERDLYGKKKCLPNGFFDLSPCYLAPLIASFPHFLYGDEEYRKTVNGLSPDEEKHQTVLHLEPVSGIPVSAKIRLQFNMIERPIPGITITQELKPSVMPVAWIEMGAVLPEDLIGAFKGLLNLAVVGVEVIKWLIVAIGACMCLICGGLYIYKLKKK